MWNVARIRVNLCLTCVFKMQQYGHFFKTFLGTGEFNKLCVCLAFNYGAGACCIWTMCFVSFVLNLGSVLLSELLKITKKLRQRNVKPNHQQ